ncbi:hypothetical protein [Actinocorallia herbida]|uniref:hypothetical protein n=1 Tax=Actinocorallia herbida TaxID=58109 RepID=UPI000F4B9A61|nr:hypothetical protein [Actinocorallia herbida]
MSDRRTATTRLVEVYGPRLRTEIAEHLERALRAGELGWTIECLAEEMVAARVRPEAGDAVEFRRLLTGFLLSPDCPPDIRDLVMFGQDPPEDHLVHLLEGPSPFDVRAAVVEGFGLPVDEIGILVDGEPAAGMPESPMVLVTADPGSGVQGVTFNAGRVFVARTGGATELSVAKTLCRALGTGAMLGPHGLTPNQWVLVTAEGGHGVVMVDGEASDEGRWEIRFAYEAVEGAPHLPSGPPDLSFRRPPAGGGCAR